MTAALCLHCGAIKFGALLDCQECGAPPTGDMGLDLLFTDHTLEEQSLRELGEVIQKIRTQAGAGDEVYFWAFITFLSRHHSELLTANTPKEIEERVNHLLQVAELSPLELQLRPDNDESQGGGATHPVNAALAQRYTETNLFNGMASVQCKFACGRVLAGLLTEYRPEEFLFLHRAEAIEESIAIVAIRKKKNWITGLFGKAPWVSLD